MNKYNLPSSERLKKEKDFKRVFSSGKVLFSSDQKFKAAYYIEKDTTEPGVKIAAAIFKRAGKAVWRNRVKRLIKESYRLNKEEMVDKVKRKNISLKIVFSLNNLNEKSVKRVGLEDVIDGIVGLMNKIIKII